MAERLARDSQRPAQQSSMAERLAGTGDPGAAFFGQAAFDRSSGLPFSTRIKVKTADNQQEMLNAFFDDYPDGDIQHVPVTGEWVFKFDKTDQTEQYKTIERDVPAEMTFDSVLKETLEFGKDVSEFTVGTGGAVASEVLAAVATRGRSLLTRLTAMAGGVAAGEFGQESAERLVYPGDESMASVGARAATGAIASPLGYGLGAGIGQLASGVRGRGILSTRPEAREAQRAINDLNSYLESIGSDVRIPQLSVGQSAKMPIFRRLEEQSAALTTPVREHRRAQIEGVQQILDSAVDERSITLGREALDNAYQTERNRLMSQIDNPRAVMSVGGEALESGIRRYDESARVQIDALYDLARRIDEPDFALGNALEGSGLMGAAVRELRGMSVPAKQLDDVQREQLAAQLGIPAHLLRSGPIQAAPVDPRVEAIAAEMISADPASVDLTVLRSWRSRLWDIKQVPTGELAGQAQFQANRLFQAVNRTIENPVNSSGRFQQAWRVANARAKDRFDTLEKAQIARILKSGDMTSTETVEQLAVNLQQPYNASNLRFLRTIIPEDEYEKFTNTFKTRLLENPDEIGAALDRFDRETLQYLLAPAERAAFRELSESLEALSSVGIEKQLKAQTIPSQFMRGLIDRGDTAGIEQLHRLVQQAGGRGSSAGRAVRYSILDAAFDKFIVDGEIDQMNTRAIDHFLRDLTDMGLGRFLSEQDRTLIRSMQKIAPFFRFGRGGAGASIQAAEAASGVIEGSPSAIWELIEKAGAGRALVNPVVRSFLLGKAGSEPIDTMTIKVITAAATTALALTAETAAGVELLNRATQE